MKIAMLARNAELYTHKRLKAAAEERGHTLDIINTLRCYMNIASHRPEVYYNGEKLVGYDAVIPRIGASITFYGTAVLRQFEMQGVYPLNESVGIGRSRDKLRSMQLLARDGIGLPVTTFAHDPKQTEEVLDLAGGGKVVAAMKRTGAAGDFRSNLHRGGTAEVIKLSPEERLTAIRSAKAMGLNVCGVDMLRANHGPVVMEVNSSPGLEGVEAATGLDIASKIIEYIEKNAKPNATKTKGKG